MLSESDATEIANRLRLLYALSAAGEIRVGDLANVTGIRTTTVSHALRLLRTAGVVRARRSGRSAYYSVVNQHALALLDVALRRSSTFAPQRPGPEPADAGANARSPAP